MSISQLPFEPNEASVDAWLASLPPHPGEACRVLNEALLPLLQSSLEADFRLVALEKLRPVLFVQSHRLLQSCAAQSLAQDEKVRKLARLCVQFPNELGKAYLALAQAAAESIDPDDERCALIVYEALSCFDLYSLRLAQTFEPPSRSFWGRICMLFALAETMAKLDWRPQPSYPPSPSRLTVQALFCRILLFRRMAPNQLPQAQIQRVHDLLGSLADLVEIGRMPVQQGRAAELRLDLDAPAEPQPFDPAEVPASSGNFRYFHCRELRSRVVMLGQPTAPEAERLEPALTVHLQIRLGGVPPVSMDTQSRNAVLIPRMDDLIAHLAILDVRSQERDRWLGGTGIALEILPLERGGGARLPSGTQSSKSAGTFAPGKTPEVPEEHHWQRGEYPCKVYRAEAPGYYLLEPTGFSPKPGMLVALNTDNRLIQLGVIAGSGKEGSSSLVAFELLASDPKPAKVYLDSSPLKSRKAVTARLSGASQDATALFSEAVRVRGGEGFSLEADGVRKRCKVLRVLQSSRDFCEYVIAVD